MLPVETLVPKMAPLTPSDFLNGCEKAGRITQKVGTTPASGTSERLTAHAGIWLSPSISSPPVLSLFGSTNLNARSANLDTELSFVLLTSSEALQKSLQDEVSGLWNCAAPWQGAERNVRWRTKTIVSMIDGML